MPNVYEIITERVMQQLASGTAPWHKPWKARGRSALPRNLITGREYRGINIWILMSSGHSSPYWLTFRQANALGGHVRQREVGSPVVYWKFGTREIQDGDEIIERKSVLCRYYTVFNLEQCDGIAAPEAPLDGPPELTPIEECDNVVTAWTGKPVIQHGGDRASYSKLEDRVRIPELQAFECAEEFHSTLFHELVHSTGHPTRLNRSTLMDTESFADENYSREELVAEMGAAFLCGITGIENTTVRNSAAYVHGWLQALKGDCRLVLIAGGQAQKAVDLIRGATPESA